MKVRIEEMLNTRELLLLCDDAQYNWGQAMRPRKTPDRLLAAQALGTEKKQASGITEALASAIYHANQDGREEVTFADIRYVRIHVHGFLRRPAREQVREDARHCRSSTIAAVPHRRKAQFISRISTPASLIPSERISSLGPG